jgi:N-sulfoglucosamine sulfohydrolase
MNKFRRCNSLAVFFFLVLSPLIYAIETQPNILFAIADDWGLHAGAYGTPWVKTPAFDRIAKEGLLFKNAYTPVAKCAPSRAIVLTGRYAWQNEEAGNHMAYFPAKLKSWPEVLTEKGWYMGISGKGWGPGIANDANGQPREITGKAFNKHKAKPPTDDMSNNDYAANFVDFLEAAPNGKSWCFWYGSTEPHRSYEFKSGVNKGGKKLTDVDDVPGYWPDDEIVRNDILDYAFEVEHTDSHLGRMIAELERRGQLDNTLIIVTSDHGMPFPRCKGYAYEDSNHIPLAVRFPKGMLSKGRAIEDFVSFIDIAPTILDYAGIDSSASGMLPITGKSWRPILESEKSGRVLAERDHTLVGKERTDVGRPHDWGYPIRGIVTHTHLFLKNYEPTRWPAGNPETGYTDTDASPTKTHVIALGRKNRSDEFWQLNFGLRPAEELYNLTTDRHCTKNIASQSDQQSISKILRSQMEEELKIQNDPRMFGNGKLFDEYPATNGAGFYDKYQRGENPKAGWISPTDIEKEPLSNE